MYKKRESLVLGNFKINAPTDWEPDRIKLEIEDYDYDSTHISIEELKILYEFIGSILNN